jgi:AcrR family transcriptional regulator
MTSDTKVRIVRAAIDAISRYGVRRTSMADVAAAAGVSRQTLYDNFANKDSLLSAAMMLATEDMMAELAAACDGCEDVGQILDAYLEHAVYRPFEIMQRLPDLKDLLKGPNGMNAQTVQALYDRKAGELAKRLAPYQSQMSAFGTDPVAVAELVMRTANDLKFGTDDIAELRRLMTTLKISVVALTR